MQRLTTLLSLLFTLISSWSHAVEIQQGQLYTSGTLLESSELGLSFRVPNHWRAAWPQGAELLILESNDQKANVFVYIDRIDQNQLQQVMSQTIPLGGGITLVPTSNVQRQQNTLQGTYQVSGQPQLQSRIHAVNKSANLAVAFIAIAPSQAFSRAQQTAQQLAKNLRYQQPVAPSAGSAGDSGSWQAYLRGRHLVRYYSGSGYSEEEHIWLCSDGRFFRSNQSGGYSDFSGASGAFAGQGQGQWQAIGHTRGNGTVILQYGQGSHSESSGPGFDWSESGPGGERITATVTLQNDKLYVDGTQWLRDGNQRCR